MRKLQLATQRELLDLFTKSAGDYLDGWFESAPIKAAYGFDSIVGNYASPYTPGSAYVLLHHVFGEVNGKKGAWGHAIGGMGAITQAMARSAEALGVEIRTGCGVREVLLEKGRATGVVTAKGERLDARVVVSNLNPRLLYTRLIDPPRCRRFPAPHGGLALRLRHLPHERGAVRAAGLQLPARQDDGRAPRQRHHHRAQPRYMERAYHDARALGWSREPIVEVLIPVDTGPDPGAARPARGQPVLPARGAAAARRRQLGHAPRHRGRPDDRHRQRHAPNFKGSVLGRQIMSPLDLERTFGLVGGDIFHGALGSTSCSRPGRCWATRTIAARSPGLYTCGAGTHPGGGVTGAPGHNAAHEVLRDFKQKKYA
jgi:phytoene dehydrogenase-like protein